MYFHDNHQKNLNLQRIEDILSQDYLQITRILNANLTNCIYLLLLLFFKPLILHFLRNDATKRHLHSKDFYPKDQYILYIDLISIKLIPQANNLPLFLYKKQDLQQIFQIYFSQFLHHDIRLIFTSRTSHEDNPLCYVRVNFEKCSRFHSRRYTFN